MISICTPTFNTTPDQLDRAYRSLTSQTHPFDEWIILDDSTSHATWPLLQSLALKDPRVKPFRSDPVLHSGSIGLNKRRAFMLAEGSILVELDHDDELLPEALARVHAAFTDHPDVGFVYSDWAEILPDGASTFYPDGWAFGYGKTLYDPTREMYYMGTAEVNSTTVRHIVSSPNHLRAWRASTYHEMGGHDTRYEVCDDYQLHVRTFLYTNLLHIPELLYIQHIAPTTAQRVRNPQIQAYVAHIVEAYDQAITDRFAQLQGTTEDRLARAFANLARASERSAALDDQMLTFPRGESRIES
jgi:glycosyltransferase involved in cell wall biosynthesis